MARHSNPLICGALALVVALLALSGGQAGRAGAQPGIAGEIGPNDLRISTMGPDGDTRFYALDPAAAYNPVSGEFLVVWAADDEAPPLGDDEFEIYGQRLAGDGALLGAHFRISTTGPDGDPAYYVRNAAVVSNPANGEYLVVWSAGGGAAGLAADEFEIYGQRLDAGGSLLGSTVRISDIGPDGDAAFDALNPALAYNPLSGEYLVVWQGDDMADNAVEIYGQRLDASGIEVGTNDLVISQMGTDPADTHFRGQEPEVTCGEAGECLVVWEGDTDAAPLVDDEYEVFGQRLAADGSLVGPSSFRISTAGPDGDPGYQARRPAVAYNGGAAEFLVAWAGDDTGAALAELEVRGQRLAADGSPVGQSGFRISHMGPDGDPAYRAWTPAVAYLAAAGRYLVVWRGDDSGDWGSGPLADDEIEIWGQMLEATGDPAGDPMRLSDAGPDGDPAFDADRPALAAQPGGDHALVAWQGEDDVLPLVEGEVEILGQLVEVETAPFPDIVVTPPPLEAALCPAATAELQMEICNVGTADLAWSADEDPDMGWLAETPGNGTLAPGACVGLEVTFDTAGLDTGTYAGSLLIDSSDPDTPQVALPAELEVLDPAHAASFTWDPPAPAVGDEVTFTGTAVGSEPVDYAWDFGDGAAGTGSPAAHTYAAFGDYVVTMTATNACGQASAQQALTVAPVGTMHVRGIKVSYVDRGLGRYVVKSQVRIADAVRVPVPGAAVHVVWTRPDGSSEAQQQLTNLVGTAGFKSQTMQSGLWQICVTEVSLTGWLYDPDQNGMTCKSIAVP